MLPLSSSYLDQEPLLAISAQVPAEFPATHTHQLLPLHDVYRPVCKLVETITASTAGDTVAGALAASMVRPYGPTYLTLSAREALKPDAAPARALSINPPPAAGAGPRATELAGALRRSRRPLVLLGLGVAPENASGLRHWLDSWGLPVAVTPKVKGLVDETRDNFVGTVGGMAADDLMCEAIKSADLVIGFGLDPVEIDKTWHAELPIHWVLEAPNVCGIVPANSPLVNHAALLEELRKVAPPAEWKAPFAEYRARRLALLRQKSGSAHTMWPGDLIEALASAVPPETIVTTDVGSHK
jgi:thiamine pyrophosphate-dependent acetolactate synthase large subunit-like protein